MQNYDQVLNFLTMKKYLHSKVIVLCKDKFYGKGNFMVYYFTALFKPSTFPKGKWYLQAVRIKEEPETHFYEEGAPATFQEVPVVVAWHKDDHADGETFTIPKLTYFLQEISVKAARHFTESLIADHYYKFAETKGARLKHFHWNHHEIRKNVCTYTMEFNHLKSVTKDVPEKEEKKIQAFVDEFIDTLRDDGDSLIEASISDTFDKISGVLGLVKTPKTYVFSNKPVELVKKVVDVVEIKSSAKEVDDDIEELCNVFDLSDEEVEKKEPFTYTTKSGEEISSAATPLNPNLYTGIDVNSIGTSLCHLKTKPENPIAKKTSTTTTAARKFSMVPKQFARKSLNEALNWRTRNRKFTDVNPDFNETF